MTGGRPWSATQRACGEHVTARDNQRASSGKSDLLINQSAERATCLRVNQRPTTGAQSNSRDLRRGLQRLVTRRVVARFARLARAHLSGAAKLNHWRRRRRRRRRAIQTSGLNSCLRIITLFRVAYSQRATRDASDGHCSARRRPSAADKPPASCK